MDDLSVNVLYDCARLPLATIYLHREDYWDTENTSKSATWLYNDTECTTFKDQQKLTRRQNNAINIASVSVYQMARKGEHQLSQPKSKGCYFVDAAELANFFIIADGKSSAQSHFFHKDGTRQVVGEFAQHLNILPKPTIDAAQAWEEFNKAPWSKCWVFSEVPFSLPELKQFPNV